jgi:hypothetical protein
MQQLFDKNTLGMRERSTPVFLASPEEIPKFYLTAIEGSVQQNLAMPPRFEQVCHPVPPPSPD